MKGALRYAFARLRARRGRALLALAGIAAACAMLGAAVTVSYSLATGFSRAAERADLADVVARFDAQPADAVRGRLGSLPNVDRVSYRLEQAGVHVCAPSCASARRLNEHGLLEGVLPGRRGYAVLQGRDLTGVPGEALIEQGLARAWGVRVGDEIGYEGLGARAGELRTALVVGITVEPENVAFPLATGPRIYVPYEEVRRMVGRGVEPVDLALVWVHDRDRLPVTLEQARAASFGVRDLRIVTRDGIRVVVDEAAGIVIALLVAFSLVALAAAGVMLGASAQAEVRRRMDALGVLRALGASRAAVVLSVALESALVAVPGALVGLAAGYAVSAGATERLLASLNELPPGRALLGPLALCLAGVVALVALASAWPAWRATARPPAGLLRGGDLATRPRGRLLPGGPAGLGMRMFVSRPARATATVAVLAASGAVVLLMLALASLLVRLQHDPGAVGKRYDLLVSAPAGYLGALERTPGVTGAALRYETGAADSYDLGETFQVVAFGGDHTTYEDPPLAQGSRLQGAGEAEVGQGLADALGLRTGATLAMQLPSGAELRFRVAGIVRALQNDGRIVYVAPRRLVAAEPGLSSQIAVRIAQGAGPQVRDAIRAAGLVPEEPGGVTPRSTGFLGVLAALLRTVAAVDGFVCLYAVVQMLALTAAERRRAVAVVRACGGGRAAVLTIFAGAAGLATALALLPALLAERLVLGPAVARIAASYAPVSLAAGVGQVAIVALGGGALTLLAAAWVSRAALRRPVVAGLREE